MADLSVHQKAARLKAAGYRKRKLYMRNPAVYPSWVLLEDPYQPICAWVGPYFDKGNDTHVWKDIDRAWDWACNVGDVHND